jgi:DeoR/GlpR family transcriptional regulator of sugar metabolism
MLPPRQKAVISLLAQFDQLSREQIADKIESLYPVSKATLARDLAELLDQKQKKQSCIPFFVHLQKLQKTLI